MLNADAMNRAVPVTAALGAACLVAVALACTRDPVPNEKPAADKPAPSGGVALSGPAGSITIVQSATAPAPTASAPPAASGGAAASASAGGGPGDMAWTAPASWKTAENTSTMRKATYKIPKVAPDADDAEMSVLAAMGGVAANVQRWEGQFGGAKAKTEEKKVGGLKVTVVEIRGTYNGSGMPGMAQAGPKEKQMLLAAIVETDPEHFFKLVGGEKTVEKARPDFDKLVASFRAK